VDKNSLVINDGLLDKITDLVKMQRNVLFERILDFEMQVLKLLGVVASQFLTSDDYPLDSKFSQKSLIFGCAFISQIQILGDFVEIHIQNAVRRTFRYAI